MAPLPENATNDPAQPPRWLKLNLLGRREVSGLVMEVREYGRTWMRLERRCPDDHLVGEPETIAPSSVYSYEDAVDGEARDSAFYDCEHAAHVMYCEQCGEQHPKSTSRCPTCGAYDWSRNPIDDPYALTPANLESTLRHANVLIASDTIATWNHADRIAALAWATRAGVISEPGEPPPHLAGRVLLSTNELQLLLEQAGRKVSLSPIMRWTLEERRDVEQWARATIAHATDATVEVLDVPPQVAQWAPLPAEAKGR